MIIQLDEARLKLASLRNDAKELGISMRVDDLRASVEDLEEKTHDQNFWNDQKNNAAEKNAGGMVPFWLPPQDHECSRKIERIIPFYPLSREHLFIDDLLKMQAVYRMVIGQPHQDELLSLLRNLSDEDREKIMRYTLSLAPKDE